jgi:hypothetical protein
VWVSCDYKRVGVSHQRFSPVSERVEVWAHDFLAARDQQRGLYTCCSPLRYGAGAGVTQHTSTAGAAQDPFTRWPSFDGPPRAPRRWEMGPSTDASKASKASNGPASRLRGMFSQLRVGARLKRPSMTFYRNLNDLEILHTIGAKRAFKPPAC